MKLRTLEIFRRVLFAGVCLPALLTVGSLAQEASEGEAPDVEAPEPDQTAQAVEATLDSLEALQRSIAAKRSELEAVETQRHSVTNEHDRANLDEQSSLLREETDELEEKFHQFAVATDTSLFRREVEEPFDLQTELEKLVKPIIAELEKATAGSREIDSLRTEQARYAEQAAVSSNAVANLDRLLVENPEENIASPLVELRALWQRRLADAENQAEAARLQLETKLAARKPLLESTGSFFKDFSRNRGMHLLLAVLAFCAVFFGLRGAYALFLKVRPLRGKRTFTSRAMDLGAQLGSGLAGLLAVIVVFNATGDWFLLGIVVLFLLGAGWAGMQTIPQHIERINLMLNVGPVREEHRLIFNDIPWRVESLGFTARLVNPNLKGGTLKLPIKDLIGCHSRQPGEREEWFPTEIGDWVELADGRFGRVTYQTPEVVQLVELGGSQVIYSTGDFIAQTPRNFTPGFRIEVVFGIDYKHQAESTTSIPELMEQALQKGLIGSVLERDEVKHLSVHFSQAAASSLDYRVILDLAGSAASKAPRLREIVVQLLVDASNQHGWEIPFQQITLHQAVG